MKRPEDINGIRDVLAWLAWLATMLGAMAAAADSFRGHDRRERERADNAVLFDGDKRRSGGVQ